MSILFEDFKKASDSVEHSAVLQDLSNQGVDPAFSVKLENENVVFIDSSVYLGQAIQMGSDLGSELGWIAFAKFRDTLTDRKMPLPVKAELFNAPILPSLLYRCETWNTALAGERKLAVTLRTMGRHMVSISSLQHVSSKDLRSRSSVKNIVEVTYARKHWSGSLGKDERQ
ncbi:unnamed protein product [Toxocara canis]|uniref:RT_RNaseH_2 domain-containing protein n=1 Tax=Toxocara canis TaxID=6265 RepID=A0A183UW90_TOXCA|nr:unnamed protein product [Toxocara canis]